MRARLKDKVSETKYFWGPLTDIEGQTLRVIERNEQGDCMCIVDGKGLVDVCGTDIEQVIKEPSTNPLDVLSFIVSLVDVKAKEKG